MLAGCCVTIWSLVFLGLAPLAEAQTEVAGARERVLEATEAVHRGTTAGARVAWERVLRGRPGDRLAVLGLATIDRLTYRYADSDRRYESLVPSPPARDDGVARQAMLGWGQSLMTRWRPEEATPLLERLALRARETDDALTEGEALLTLTTVIARRAAVDSVRRMMDRIAVVIPPSEAGLHALRLCTQAAFVRGSDLRAADSLVNVGVQFARRSGRGAVEARCLFMKGQVHEGRGQIGLARQVLEEASNRAAALHEEEGLGAIRQWLAYLAITYSGEFGHGRRLAELAIENGRRVGSPLIVAWAELNLAQLSLRVGDAAAALRAARAAREEFARLGDRYGELATRTIVAEALFLSGRLEEAERGFLDVESHVVAQGMTNALPQVRFRRAMIAIERGDLDRAAPLIEQATADAVARGIRGLVTSDQHYVRGLLQLRTGDYDRAIASLLAFKRGIGASASHHQLDADLRIAETMARDGRFTPAESVFAAASALLDRMRNMSHQREDLVRLLSGQRYEFDPDLGIATTVSLFARAGRIAQAFAIAESERARSLWVQRTRRSAMARQKGGARQHPLDRRMLALEDVQRALDGETAVLEFVTGRGGEPTSLFAIWRTGARVYTLAAGDTLGPAVSRFVGLLESGAPARGAARSLGVALLDSALAALPPLVRQLRISPDGALHHLPFDALEIASGQRLVERYVTSIVQSARLAVAAPASSSGSGSRRGVLALGDAVFDARHALPRLPGSGEEARRVVRAAGAGESLLRQRALKSAISGRSWEGIGVIHFATHARVQDWALLGNAIYLTASGSHDGRIGVEDLEDMNLDVDLVVLSGCRTVGGVVTTGEGVQGLAAPILEAGARAVAVTNWNIRDRSLIVLMERFYREMARGLTAAAALRQAKLAALHAGASPAVWAAVTLLGDADVRPLAAGRAPRLTSPESSRD